MAVFTSTSGSHNLTVTTTGDWTFHNADLPNGDKAASLNTSLNENARWTTNQDFCLPATAGSDARTFECWVKVTSAGTIRVAGAARTDSTSTSASQRHWWVLIGSDNAIDAIWFSTSGTYLQVFSTGSIAGGWHHIVVIYRCGSTRSIEYYCDTVLKASAASPAGTPTTSSSGTYNFYLGAVRTNNTWEMTDHMSKVAWYTRALTPTEINNHYLAMAAT